VTPAGVTVLPVVGFLPRAISLLRLNNLLIESFEPG
jgi:hypothetical protein